MLAPLAAAPGRLQLWQVATSSGRPLAAGQTVTLRSLGRAGCTPFLAAAMPHCGSDSVLLSSSPQGVTARWMLHAGPRPGTFYLASAACPRCERRWLGAACDGATLRLFARDSVHGAYDGASIRAQLLWRLAL